MNKLRLRIYIKISVSLVLIYIVLISLILRFVHPEYSETQLFLKLFKALIWNFN